MEGNTLLDLAPSKRKSVYMPETGNMFSWNATPEFAKFVGSAACTAFMDDGPVQVNDVPELKALEERLLKRHAKRSYKGEDPEGNNYLLWCDWFPSMSAKDMDIFMQVISSWWLNEGRDYWSKWYPEVLEQDPHKGLVCSDE